jgi:hypothetical protein
MLRRGDPLNLRGLAPASIAESPAEPGRASVRGCRITGSGY